MIDITKLYTHYLDVKNFSNYEANTLYLLEDDDFYFAFNIGAYTLSHIFNTCVCNESLTIKDSPVMVFYSAIPKMDSSIITRKIIDFQYRCAIVTLL